MLNMFFNTLLKITPHNTQKRGRKKKEQSMYLHNYISGGCPIQFLTPPTGLNLRASTKLSFARVIARYVFLLTLHSDEDIADFNGNTIISTASVTSLIKSPNGQRKADATVTRESCPSDVWRWITIS